MNELSTYDVLGVPISVVTPEIALDRITQWAADDRGRFVCIRDVASLMAIISDDSISALHKDAAMVTPDGSPLAIIGKLKGKPVERTCGPDLMDLVMKNSPKSGLKHYFYGGGEGVAEKMKARFEAKYPGLSVVGCECPPYGVVPEEGRMAALERIRNSGADVVWVGISSPKQDVWMWKNVAYLPQTLIGVGAAFDFHSGMKRRAPPWMRRMSLEWLFRLMSEPRRLWRRYLVLAPTFVAKVAWSSLRK